MAICLFGFSRVSRTVKYESLSGRLEAIELDEKMGGPDRILSTLVFDNDYEEEFDDYWDFANVRRAYIQGRAADDKSSSIAIIQNYIDSTTYDNRRDAAKRYLEDLQ